MKMLFKYYPILLIILSFAPYLYPGSSLKVADLVIYPISVLVFLVPMGRKKIRINKSIFGIFILWTAIALYSFLRTLIGGGYLSPHAFMADINNFAQPIAILSFFLFIIYKKTKDEILQLIKLASYTLLILLSVNALWTILGFFVDFNAINIYFLGGDHSLRLTQLLMEDLVEYSTILSKRVYLIQWVC